MPIMIVLNGEVYANSNYRETECFYNNNLYNEMSQFEKMAAKVKGSSILANVGAMFK